ncbi:MAG: hypothetical protein KC609_11680, partial [Myxococcales bacterium]|nr:hypothetical protein [Myxococcales bacterium]
RNGDPGDVFSGGNDAVSGGNDVVSGGNDVVSGGSDIKSPDSLSNGGQPGLTDDVERAALSRVAAIYRTIADSSGGLWGGAYKMETIPTYLVRRDASGKGLHGFLLHHPSPPSDAKLIRTADAGGLSDVYRWDGAVDQVVADTTFEFTYSLNGAKTYVMPFRDTGEESFESVQQQFLFLHEGFHRFQEVEGGWTNADGTPVVDSFPLTQTNLELVLLEDRTLLNGLKATAKADKITALRRFLAIRETRRSLDQSVRDALTVEEIGERIEGTPTYIEALYASIAGVTDPFTVQNLPAGRLEITFLYDGAGKRDLIEYFAGARYYGSGGALCLLLDEAGVVGWRAAIASGATLTKVIGDALPVSNQEIAALLEDAKSATSFEAELKPLAQRYAAAK